MMRTAAFLVALALAAAAAYANEKARKANAIARAPERTYSPEAYRECAGFRAGTNQRLLCLERWGRQGEEWSGSAAIRFCQALPGDEGVWHDCVRNPRKFGYREGKR
jgi:hypothetical protein